MSNHKLADIAKAQNAKKVDDPFNDELVPHQLFVRSAVENLAHMTMTYGCDKCGFHWTVWLTMGCEGPKHLKELGLYVPVPFTAGQCPSWPVNPDATPQEVKEYRHLTKCEGTMSHVRWNDDEEFRPELTPDDRPRFVLDPMYEHGRLVIPTDALVAARCYHADKE